MTQPELLTEKIRLYLQALSPRAVETLVRKLEHARDRGIVDPHAELILAASVELLRKPDPVGDDVPAGVVRRSQVQRQFFAPLDEFLINEQLPHKQDGRVYRPLLNRVWTWLGRDILPGDIKMVLSESEKSTASNERIDNLIRALRRRSVDAVGKVLEQIEVSDKDRRRLAIEVGGERGIADLKDIYKIFAAEKWLMPFLHAVPESLNENRLKVDHDVLSLVNRATSAYPDYIPVFAAALLERADAPAALCSFAGRLAHSDDAKAIADSIFSPFVDVVLSEAERLNILAMQHRNHNPDPVAFSQALSDYHNLVRGVDRDIDLSSAGPWRTRLATTKRNVSDVVTRELNGAHGAIRRALQVPKWNSSGELEQDMSSINDAVRTLRVLVMARGATETLAVNDIGKRTRQAVEQTLEIVTRSLFNDLGKHQGKQFEAQLAAVDVAIMLSEIYYGADYAVQLRRRRQSAMAKTEPTAPVRRTPEARLVASALGRS